jgi:hypothetical protein
MFFSLLPYCFRGSIALYVLLDFLTHVQAKIRMIVRGVVASGGRIYVCRTTTCCSLETMSWWYHCSTIISICMLDYFVLMILWCIVFYCVVWKLHFMFVFVFVLLWAPYLFCRLPTAQARSEIYWNISRGAWWPETNIIFGLNYNWDYGCAAERKEGNFSVNVEWSRWNRYNHQGSLDLCLLILNHFRFTGNTAVLAKYTPILESGVLTFI